MDTLQRDVLVGAVFSATLFRNFSSHVNVRRFHFCFDSQKFPPDSNVISGKERNARAPDLQMVTFDLPLSALLQCLLFRAVRSLLLMRSLTDATELYTGMELHISACCPNQAEL